MQPAPPRKSPSVADPLRRPTAVEDYSAKAALTTSSRACWPAASLALEA
jgi:hypothetical protein